MDPSLLVFKAKYEIRAAEVDRDGQLNLPALLQLMQETSLKHVIQLKASIWDLKDSSWVLLSKDLKINRRPVLGEKITIHTYPAGVKRIYAYRDYWVYGPNGDVLAYAATTWTLMNLTTRKMVPIPIPITELPLPKGYEILERSSPTLVLAKAPYETSGFQVGYFHLDWNNHVNNVHYAKFMLESVASLFNRFKPSDMKIIFRGEALMGDLLQVQSHFDDSTGQSNHKIISPDSKVISQASIHWEIIAD